MSLSLYDITVPTYLQIVQATEEVLKKGEAFCAENNTDPMEMVQCQLYKDMAPLRFQVFSVAHHSIGAIKGIEAGIFGPPKVDDSLDYAGLINLMQETQAQLKAIPKEKVDALEGGDMTFKMGSFEIPFTTENFILSFSMPNFYFHATTAYDILRMKGVELGKQDFMGPLRVKQS